MSETHVLFIALGAMVLIAAIGIGGIAVYALGYRHALRDCGIIPERKPAHDT